MAVLIEDDIATVTDGTARNGFVCTISTISATETPWAFKCFGDPKCRVLGIGWRRMSQAIRAAEWHLKWHRNGEPRCQDCGADLGRKGATRCPADMCSAGES